MDVKCHNSMTVRVAIRFDQGRKGVYRKDSTEFLPRTSGRSSGCMRKPYIMKALLKPKSNSVEYRKSGIYFFCERRRPRTSAALTSMYKAITERLLFASTMMAVPAAAPAIPLLILSFTNPENFSRQYSVLYPPTKDPAKSPNLTVSHFRSSRI